MISAKTPYILYGGDYNPDQWSKEIIEEDMRLFNLANINIVTLPVFSWSRLQPDEHTYNFEWLDEILNTLKKNNISVCFATSTAVQPAWMSKKYPEILPTDFYGRKRKFGGRVKFCPNSVKYKEFSVKLATKLAQRYKDYPNIVAWHIGNEYDNYCYCEHCEDEFRKWVKDRYQSIENVNKAWNMNFWGHTLYEFDEIVTPNGLSEVWHGYDKECTNFQGIALDYNRFMCDSILNCYKGEYEAIKSITPDIPITTNLMGTFKPLDYFKWADYMDIISWDNYPSLDAEISDISLRHDLMRSLKDGKPFMLMEQTPNQTNWQPYNSVKRPGVMRLLSYQSIAHGADTVMFFQMRQSIGACEKYHAAVISHAGHEHTRIFKECSQLGEELKNLGDAIIDSTYDAKVGIIFDWDNWWAVEFSSGPSIQLKYIEQIEKYYKAFHQLNVMVDFVKPTGDLSKYEMIVAPVLYMLHENVADNIKRFVSNGGTFITTYFSGYVNENDIVQLGGYPAELRDLLGVWVEELDALPNELKNSIEVIDDQLNLDSRYTCNMLCDILNLESATPLAVYGSDFYQGRAVFTVNHYGKGKAYYIAANPEQKFINDFFTQLVKECQLLLDIVTPEKVEMTIRTKNNQPIIFLLNHNPHEVTITLNNQTYINLLTQEPISKTITLKAKDVAILR